MKKKSLLLRLVILLAAMMCALGAAAVEAYACYTESNTTLTFYYDGIRGSRTGTTYDLTLEDGLWPGWYFDYDMQAAVTRVVFDLSFSNVRPQTTYAWFSGMSNLTTITGMKEYLNTSEVTNMNIMFSGCSSLTSLDVSGFNTGNVEYMASMFAYCSSLTNLDLSNFNTSQVQFMNYMFSYCRKLKSVNLSSFNTANVLEMSGLFTECNELASVDLTSFNTARVTNMHNMFLYCSNLTSLDISGFNTANVTDMQDMFAVCPGLTTIYVGDEWSTDAVTQSANMFYGCTSLVGGQGTTWNDSNPKDKTYAHIDGGPSNPGYLTEIPEAYACYTESNTTLTFYCDNQRSSRTGTTYDVNLNQGTSFPAWFTNDVVSNVTKAVFDPSFANARPTSTGAWFFYMSKLKSITGLNFLNTSEVTYMASMFADCSNLTNLDLSSWNTAKVTDMMHMFRDCSGLTTIYVGDEWSTSAVTKSNNMFYGCTSLVGGMGTTYDASHKDATYAHIDGGPSNPGYFTDKNAALRGDVNGDGNVNISDVTVLINYLLNHDATGVNLQNADCDQNGEIKISDVTALINYLLNNTWN